MDVVDWMRKKAIDMLVIAGLAVVIVLLTVRTVYKPCPYEPAPYWWRPFGFENFIFALVFTVFRITLLGYILVLPALFIGAFTSYLIGIDKRITK